MFEGFTYYAIKPFYMIDEGLFEGQIFEVCSIKEGINYVKKLNDSFVGFILFSRILSPFTGQYSDAYIINSFGKNNSII